MVKIGGLNRINVAADWIAEQLGDDGYTPDYLLDLGTRGELALQAVIPPSSLKQPKDGKGLGMSMVFLDGVVDLDSLDCRGLQAQGSINVSEVNSGGILRQLDRSVTITYDDVRIEKDVMEGYVTRHKEREMLKQAQINLTPCGANEKSAPSSTSPAPHWTDSARAIADEFYNIDTAYNCRDSLAGYSRRVTDEMQKREIHGPRGLFDNPRTVQRDALQGEKWWKVKVK